MATHDYVIANGTGQAVRSDLNDALAAIVSNNSSSSEPATTYAYQWWADTNANVLKIRNSANNGWITLRELDGTMLIEDGTASLPGLAFADDTNTGIFSGGADEINISTAGTERVVVNSSGDVGIGTTSPNQLLELGTADPVIRFSRPGDINAIDSTLGKIEFFNNDTSSDGPTLSASIQAFTASTTGAGGYLTFSTENNSASSPIAEAMRIDRLGNVGIGTASPSNALHVNSGTTDSIALFESSDTIARIILRDGNSTSGGYLGVVGEEMTFSTSGSERMRLSSTGSLLWQATEGLSSTVSGVQFSNPTHPLIRVSGGTTTTNRNRMEFVNGNGTVGSISTSGTATAYNTSSDYRLKENVVDINDGIVRVKQLAPKRFNFIADADTTVDGFLAHEAQSVVPEAVTGTHNEVDDDDNPVYQGIDQSKLVPLLTAALQEAIAKIETLETKVAALEAG